MFLYQLVLHWRLAAEHNRPNRQNSYPQSKKYRTYHKKRVGLGVGGVVVDLSVFDVILEGFLDLGFVADFWYAESCEGVDVAGVIFPVDEEVVVGRGRLSVLALVLLAGVVGGDA